jgi:hypothetical protein
MIFKSRSNIESWGSHDSGDTIGSVFSRGRYVGAILHRGCKGYEAIGEEGTSHGCFPSQREAAAALQQLAVHPPCPGD